jgi:heteromeric Ino2p/Ino4p transcription factor
MAVSKPCQARPAHWLACDRSLSHLFFMCPFCSAINTTTGHLTQKQDSRHCHFNIHSTATMSSPTITTSPNGAREVSANPSSSGNVDDKPRLSEHEKKANHIASGSFPPSIALLYPVPIPSHSLTYSLSLPIPIPPLKSQAYPACPLEQKRRQAIREGFDRLTELVPGLEGQGRSESVVLKKTVDHMRAQLEERRRLVQRIEALGGNVELSLRR